MEVPGQTLLADSTILTEGTTRSLTVIVNWLLVTGLGNGHTAFEVMITVILSAFEKVDEVKVLLLLPTFTPLTCHW